MSFAHFSPCGKMVVTAAGYSTQVWDTAGTAGADVGPNHCGPVKWGVEFYTIGSKGFTMSHEVFHNRARPFSIRSSPKKKNCGCLRENLTGKLRLTLQGHQGSVRCTSFSSVAWHGTMATSEHVGNFPNSRCFFFFQMRFLFFFLVKIMAILGVYIGHTQIDGQRDVSSTC